MTATVTGRATSDEEAMILDVVRQLVKEKVEPRAAEIDASGEYPLDIKQLFAENDLLYEGTQQIQRIVIARSMVGKWTAPAR